MYNRKMIRNFNQHVHTYDQFARVQKQMAAGLCNGLKKMTRKFSRIFEAGCGTGLFSQMLLDALEPGTMYLNDISPAMLKEVRSRITGDNRPDIIFSRGDIEEMPFPRELDLYAANAVFQWIRDLDVLLERIYSSLSDGGVLAFSLFISGTFHELEQALDRAFREYGLDYRNVLLPFLDRGDIEKLLKKNGFRIVFVSEDLQQEYFDHPKEFLKSIKGIGAAHFNREVVPFKVMRKMMQVYMENFSDRNNKVSATYRVLLCLACKQ